MVFSTCLLLTAINTRAHSPSNMIISYNTSTNNLSVTITHVVSDPNTHYVESVTINLNGSNVITQPYSSQPSSSSFTYNYTIIAITGATIQVTADCNIGGTITRSLTVGEPQEPPSIPAYTGLALIITSMLTILSILTYKQIKTNIAKIKR